MKLINKVLICTLSCVGVVGTVSIPTSLYFIDQHKSEIKENSKVYFDDFSFRENLNPISSTSEIKELLKDSKSKSTISKYANIDESSIEGVSIREGAISEKKTYSLNVTVTLVHPHYFQNNNSSTYTIENVETQIPANITNDVSDDLYFDINADGVLVGLTEFGNQQETLKLPESVTSIQEGTAVGQCLFNTATKLKKVILPSSLKNLSKWCFSGSTIESIDIPNTLSSLGYGVFESCTNLSSVTFASNSSLKSIGGAVFRKTALTNVTIPENITTISDAVFQNITSLETVYILGINVKFSSSKIFTNSTNVKVITLEETTYMNFKNSNQIISGTANIFPESQLIYVGVGAVNGKPPSSNITTPSTSTTTRSKSKE